MSHGKFMPDRTHERKEGGSQKTEDSKCHYDFEGKILKGINNKN